MTKRITALFIIVCLLIGQTVLANTGQTADYLLSAVPRPGFGSSGGEWIVFGLARSEKDVPDGYFDIYYQNLIEKLNETDGILHERKFTEYARVVLALASIGKNPMDVGGYNTVKPLYDFDQTVKQGVNGAVYALMALDCVTEEITDIKQKYIDFILSKQLPDGGFSLAGAGEVDLTAMVLCALSPYRSLGDVNEAVEKALNFISVNQDADGGFSMYGVKTSESSAQVLTALSVLGINDTDERFVKNGNTVTENLLSFKTENGGFLHTKEQFEPNLMSTEQAFYALASKERLENGKTSLFDMKISECESEAGEKADSNEQKPMYPGKSFSDISGIKEQEKIEALAEHGFISGMSDTLFAPFNTMTRAEFATVCTKAMGVQPVYEYRFSDVTQDKWYYPYVAASFNAGIIKGVSENIFNPNGTLSLSETAVMVCRIAEYYGMDISASDNEIMFVLSQFEDYTSVPEWSRNALCYCYKTGILSDDAMRIEPIKSVNRAEIAGMLFELLKLCGKL